MILLWNNLFDTGTITASTEDSLYPASNLQHIHLVEKWRSTDIAAAQWILIDAGVGNTITADSAAIIAHNLTAGATIKIQGNATDLWTGPSLDISFVHSADIMTVLFTEASYRYWRFYLLDTANPDGYIETGRVSGGSKLQMPPVEAGIDIPDYDTSRKSFSKSGQGYGDFGYQYRAPGFFFPIIDTDQKSGIKAMWKELRNVIPLVLLIWENSLSVEPPIYCSIDQEDIPWKRSVVSGIYWQISINFREEF